MKKRGRPAASVLPIFFPSQRIIKPDAPESKAFTIMSL